MSPAAVRCRRGAVVVGTACCALLAGCVSGAPPALAPPQPDAPDDPVTIDASCAVSEHVPTVVTVRVDVAAAAAVDEVRVDFGPPGDLRWTAPAEPDDDGSWEAVLVGNKPLSEVEYRPRVAVDGQDHLGALDRCTTGPGPDFLPDASVERASGDAAGPGFLVTAVLTHPSAAVVLDGDGDYVWWHRPADDEELLINRAVLSVDGRSVLYLAAPALAAGGGGQRLVRASFDGIEVTATDVPGAHHDLVELPDGTVALLSDDARTVDGDDVLADRIIEVAPDGTIREAWSVWDHLEYAPLDDPYAGSSWTHANALDHDPDGDVYQLSLRNLDAILAIDRAGGEVLWTLGGADGDYPLADGGTALFDWQHQFQVLDGSVLVFDNGAPPRFASRAVEYALDDDAGLATPVWSYATDPPLYTVGYGDVARLPGGDTLVTWSTSGQVDQVTAAGELVWRLNLELGGGIGYVHPVPSLYGAGAEAP